VHVTGGRGTAGKEEEHANDEFYSTKSLLQRESLKYDPRIVEALDKVNLLRIFIMAIDFDKHTHSYFTGWSCTILFATVNPLDLENHRFEWKWRSR
jgi:hypothetical protein